MSVSQRSLTRSCRVAGFSLAAFLAVTACGTKDASAQAGPPPLRDRTWKNVTGVAVIVGGATQLLMPRIFYPEPEVTVGWKARWHISVLAPVMTLTSLALINEYQLKSAVKGFRPNCDDQNQGLVEGCTDYGAPSTHTFAAFSALGHGLGVFIVDTTKWSDGRVNIFSVIGNIGVPLITSVITYVGRKSGRTFSAPVSYKRKGDHVTIGVAMPDKKSWWRNFYPEQGPIVLQLDGIDRPGEALAHRKGKGVYVSVELAPVD